MKLVRLTIGVCALIFAAASVDAGTGFPSRIRSFKGAKDAGTVNVVVRKGGHLSGESYIVELRPTCGKKAKSIQDLEVRDARSACFADPNSLEMSEDKATLTIKIREVDYPYQTDFSLRHPERELKTRCLRQTVTHTFNLKDICVEVP